MTELALTLFLAQTCVSEISFQPAPTECVLMWEINARNAKRNGVSLEQQTRKFNAYWRTKHTTRKWIEYLNHEALEPRYWPKSAHWQHYRSMWQRYLKAAREFLHAKKSGSYKPICRGADDYGGRCDRKRGACDPLKERLSCAILEHCLRGRTLQHYWSKKFCFARKKEPDGRGGKDSDLVATSPARHIKKPAPKHTEATALLHNRAHLSH